MDERRLRVTVDESRHLFQNLLQEARVSYREVFPESTDTTGDENGRDGDANWHAVDREIRAVYEMSRFALDVAELPRTDDLDDFRGFCEDVDGLEPLDKPLLNNVGRLCVQINDQLLANSEYRRKIPRVVEKSFKTYMSKKSDYYDRILAQAQLDSSSSPAHENDSGSALSMPPETLLNITSELARRVELITELLEVV